MVLEKNIEAGRDKGRVVRMRLIMEPHDNADELLLGLDRMSNPLLYDPTIEWFELGLVSVYITAKKLAALVQALNRPLRKARNGTGSKWDRVWFSNCTLARPGTTQELAVNHNKGVCSQENIQLFISALARGTSRIRLSRSPDILECVCQCPPIELKELQLCQQRLFASEYARIGDWIQSCVSLKDLHIRTDDFEEPLMLGQGLANAFHLQKISFMRSPWGQKSPHCLVRGVFKSILGHLRSPQSRLQELNLSNTSLEDHHFLQIVELLPTSQLQELDVNRNFIGKEGILAFAHQLPRIKCLKTIEIDDNPWSALPRENHYRECVAALLQGMVENYSIERFHVSWWHRWGEAKMRYWTLANRIRGRILATANSIPVGLWPLILELVGTSNSNPEWDEGLKFRNYRANAVYFVVQNFPFLSSASQKACQCSSPSLRRSHRKRKSVDRYCWRERQSWYQSLAKSRYRVVTVYDDIEYDSE